jgi:hypothetical protein
MQFILYCGESERKKSVEEDVVFYIIYKYDVLRMKDVTSS